MFFDEESQDEMMTTPDEGMDEMGGDTEGGDEAAEGEEAEGGDEAAEGEEEAGM